MAILYPAALEMRRSTSLHHSTALALVAALVLLAGCDSDGDEGGDSTTDPTTTPTTTSTNSSSRVAAPKANESLEDAARRLEAAVKDGGCEEINSFVPTSRSDTHATEARCKAVQARLDGATVEGTDEFDGAGVIDFVRGARTIGALMVVDRTGRYKLAQLPGFLGQPSAGTEPAKGFDKAAKEVVQVFAEDDCAAFRELSSYHLGPGNARRSEKVVCAYVANAPIARMTQDDPNLKPEPLGGNSQYAFYGLPSKTLFLTMVMTRQSNKNLPETVEQLPDGAAEYVFLDAVPTNSAPSDDG